MVRLWSAGSYFSLKFESTVRTLEIKIRAEDLALACHGGLMHRASPLGGGLAFCLSMIFSENRFPLFGIML